MSRTPEAFGQASVPELLHDATLETVAWMPAERVLRLRFDCLRRAIDGSELPDRHVDLALTGVHAVAVSYDTGAPDERPSSVVVPDDRLVPSLDPWPLPASEVDVTIGSVFDEETVAIAARTDWLVGSRESAEPAPVRFCVHFDRGVPRVTVQVWIAAEGLEAWSTGERLPLATWAAQARAWWRGWEEHWEAEASGEHSYVEEPSSVQPVGSHIAARVPEEAAFIPVRSEPPPDPGYEPPDEPTFDLDPNDAPRELLAPVRDWFEALVACDWERRALAERDVDVPLDVQIERVRAACTTFEHGRWGYARAVDTWWIEGARAFVRIRGIEHSMATDEAPAVNTESVWDLELRRREGKWRIVRYAQGWPPYGSAATKPASEKPWLAKWKSGDVETGSS